MTIRYQYKCNVCNNDYIEQRKENEPLFFPKCQAFNCTGENIEESFLVIEVPTVEETNDEG